jgi:hypothetical protein
MANGKLSIALLVIALLSLIFASAYMMKADVTPDPEISESQAISLVINNSNASEYMSTYFKTPEWGISRATLVESPNDISISDSDDTFWKVELMERSCACSGVKDLYVVEGYVSSRSGEVLDVKTMSVLESEYDKKTCATTACH